MNVDELIALGADRHPVADACTGEPPFDPGVLVRYRRRRLSEVEVEQVEQHLVECAFCREHIFEIEVPRLSGIVYFGAGLALAAGFILYAISGEPSPPSAYAVVEVRGQITELRSGDLPRFSGRTFGKSSQVAIKVEPVSDPPATSLAAFVLDEGLLVPLPAAEIELGEGGVFWIRGNGRALFGDAPGKKRLVLVASRREIDTQRLSKRSVDDILIEAGFSVVTLDVDYVE